MIHNDIQNQLALLVKTAAEPLIEVAQDVTQTPQWVPGERLPAYVLASLPNGRFQVQIQDQVLDMNLPRNSEPGEQIELTFISSSPRLTFALTNDLARTLPPSSGVTLSDTAKFLGALLQQSGTGAELTSPLAKVVPVLAGAPTSAQDFAVALRSAVSQSGLFYESHQAQWVNGARSIETLRQEPQANLPPLASASGGPAPSVDDKLALDMMSTVKDPVHPLAQPLVQQQLETLDTRQIQWQGQVWPGQDMDWQIEEDNSHGANAEDEAPRWRTHLHLDLPGLGGVTARLALDGKGVRVEMNAERSDSAAMLRQDILSLADAMEASGLKVGGLSVRENGRS